MKNKLKEIILSEMVKVLSDLELKIYQARQDRMQTRIQRYFNSTPLRNVFARICVYARCVNQFYTISYIADELRATRQSISQMVDECEEEGWVNVERTPNRVGIQASQSLYDGMLDYTKQRKKLAKDVIKWKWNDLARMFELVESDFTFLDYDSVKSDDIDDQKKNDRLVG
jgi:DNA-binding MarR family transcriptional regulator